MEFLLVFKQSWLNEIILPASIMVERLAQLIYVRNTLAASNHLKHLPIDHLHTSFSQMQANIWAMKT